MNDLTIGENFIKFENPDQILNMGGPWVGDMYVNDIMISGNILIDNIVYSNYDNKLYFVKYNNISKWANNNYFSLYFINLSTFKFFEYNYKFSKIYIEKIINDELFFYKAFHNSDDTAKDIIKLDDSDLISKN